MPQRRKSLTVDALWRCERMGSPSLSPDAAQAVAAVTRYSMEDNKGSTRLMLFSMLGGQARELTVCGEKDGQPQWSPRGDLIGFVARREQEGSRDEAPQFYVIAPDGGEARRVGRVPAGIEAFKWFPDGRRILFVSWVWPELKGAAAQARRHKAWTERKETGYATSEQLYRHWDHFIPMDRVPHLCTLDIASGRVRDLFEGTRWELPRREPDATTFDISPDGRRIAFVFDPASEKRGDARFAIIELELRGGRAAPVAQDADWSFGAPSYRPDGGALAFLASHQARTHTAPSQLAQRRQGAAKWELLSALWDREPHAPLRWSEAGDALLFSADDLGRHHLWRWDIAAARAEVLHRGGWVNGFDRGAGDHIAVLCDSAEHPARLYAVAPGAAASRVETLNDALLAGFELGRTEEIWIEGGRADGDAGHPGDKVQVWVHYPPGFDPKKKYPLLHSIHGGPHTGPGDNWHYRWNYKLFAGFGYVVLNVNYHGSSGFGHAFLDSITHRWGALELQDVEAATDWALKQPWSDARRLFATGGSYGGFMVAWMNGHLSADRYRAYVCHAGCYDWTAMFSDDAYHWHAKELGAWYWDDPGLVDAQSPRAAAGAMGTPTLVIHGLLDYRVPDQQGLAYYNTLKARGVEARLLWYPDENHWILKPRNSRQWYGEFFDWLAQHDPGARGSARRQGRGAPARRAGAARRARSA